MLPSTKRNLQLPTLHIPQLLLKPGIHPLVPNRTIRIQPAKCQDPNLASPRSRIERISCRIVKSWRGPNTRHCIVCRESRLWGLLWMPVVPPAPLILIQSAMESLQTATTSFRACVDIIDFFLKTPSIERPVDVLCSGICVSKLLLKPILRCLKVFIYRFEGVESVVEVLVHMLLSFDESHSSPLCWPWMRCYKKIISGRNMGKPNRCSESVVRCTNNCAESTQWPSNNR